MPVARERDDRQERKQINRDRATQSDCCRSPRKHAYRSLTLSLEHIERVNLHGFGVSARRKGRLGGLE